MDLVDEEDVALLEAGQDRGDVAFPLEGGAGDRAQADAELFADDVGEARLAEARRTDQQQVVGHVDRGVELPQPLERAADDLGDDGEGEPDEEDEAEDDLKEPDRPVLEAVVLVQRAGVQEVGDPRPQRGTLFQRVLDRIGRRRSEIGRVDRPYARSDDDVRALLKATASVP